MPRYFLHIVSHRVFPDTDGVELADLQQAYTEARAVAEDIAEFAAGGRVEIADEQGEKIGAVLIPTVTQT